MNKKLQAELTEIYEDLEFYFSEQNEGEDKENSTEIEYYLSCNSFV